MADVPELNIAGGSSSGIGDWISNNPYLAGALGVGGAAAAILLRKPALGAVGELTTGLTNMVKGLPAKLPKELPLLKYVPDSPVISLTEKHGVEHANWLKNAVTGPLESLTRARPATTDWIAAEARAVSKFNELAKAGADEMTAYKQAFAEIPPELREPMRYLKEGVGPLEDTAAQYLGERSLPKVPYPYLPRITDKAYDNTVKIGQYGSPLSSEIRSTLGSFEEKRAFQTMAEGIANGENYIDPNLALLHRVHAGVKLITTADYIKSLEDSKVLFNTKEAAEEYAKLYPKGGGATLVEGIPGSKDWWSRSKIEAQFIRDQMVNPRTTGGLTNLVYQSNRFLRNPNLFNPLPHFTKNMLFKYGWSGGNLFNVAGDMKEFFAKANPEKLALFEQVMPFAKGGDTATELLLDAAAKIKGSSAAELGRILQTPNKWSSKIIFEKLDPALRYSRWNQYYDKFTKANMPSLQAAQEAANHTWIDLIRYGTRSDLVDFWKSIPMNFFVPWRVGTITSLLKNVRQNPAEAALFLGGVDLMREILYRKTGWWFHTPSDYVTTPVVKTIEGFMDNKHQQGAKAMAAIAGTTALFGPGGEGAVRLIENTMKSLDKGSPEYKQAMSMFWGLASILDPYGSFSHEVVGYLQDNDPKHLVRLLQSAALGAHNALNYRPRRPFEVIPESWISKSDAVKVAETMQEMAKMRMERRRPTRSIAERLGEQ